MYIIKNALENVLRNRGRNILLACIILAIVATTVVSLMISNTANGIIDDYKNRFGSEVFISRDTSLVMASGGISAVGGKEVVQLTPQQSIDFAASEYIQSYIMKIVQNVASEHLQAVGIDVRSYVTSGTGTGGDEYITPQLKLWGDKWAEFENGNRIIIDGSMVENDGECVISKDLAELNGLSAGDTITLKYSVYYNINSDCRTVTQELTVVGIYEDYTAESISMYGMIPSLLSPYNEILTTFNTVYSVFQPGEFGFDVDVQYFLKNPSMLADFENYMRENGLSEYLKVTTDEEAYNKVVGPVEGMKNITMVFMVIVLALGAVIIMLLASIAIRERKYEIGVLRAMGMKKGKVALGLWIEMIAITFVCLVIGLTVGTFVAQPVSDALLAEQIAAVQITINPYAMMQGNASGILTTNAALYSALDQLDVSIGLSTLLEIIGISLMLASVAAIAAISKITKYEPIKILMERS